jgi:hypothetical protein
VKGGSIGPDFFHRTERVLGEKDGIAVETPEARQGSQGQARFLAASFHRVRMAT